MGDIVGRSLCKILMLRTSRVQKRQYNGLQRRSGWAEHQCTGMGQQPFLEVLLVKFLVAISPEFKNLGGP
jgi:hypothetical protein